jgi:Flp pilus assembly protein TadD
VAASLIEAAIKGSSTIAAYHGDLGEMYRLLGRTDAAETAFQRALQLDPNSGGAANNLAILLQERGRLPEAVTLYRRAITAMPNEASPLMNLGSALLATGAIEEAIEQLERAQLLAPADPVVLLNLGNGRIAEGRLDDAAACFRQALALRPGYAHAELNLGRALRELGNPREALEHYQAALTLAPDLPVCRWNAGSCQLLLGDYRAGWRGFAERWRAGAVPPHGLAAPEWQGDSLAGKRLLVHAEQGLGDTIQFVRFLDRFDLSQTRITLLCQPPLARLIGDNGISAVTDDTTLPPHDLRVPLLDLPRHFDVTLSELPGRSPYLEANPAATLDWRRRLGPGTRIGIAWQGRRDHANDRQRSVGLAALAPLFAVPGIRWFSLQKDRADRLPPGVVDLAPDLADMADTAAVIAGLDAVVAVDTAVAHLTGAIGARLHLLLPFAPDWRWLTERDDSPWYPTARLYRQVSRGDWTVPIAHLAAALRDTHPII